MARHAVLGANSFAGSGLVALALRRGHDVLGISRSPEGPSCFHPYRAGPRRDAYRFVQLDLNEEFPRLCERLDAFAPDVVFDLAGQGMVAESWSAPQEWYRTNLLSKVVLHDFLRTRSWLGRYVRAGTPEVYGNTAAAVSEDHPYAPSTPYAVSHAAVDMSLSAFFRQYGFPVVIGRFANFFGAGQQLYRIVPRAVLAALSGRKLGLHGGGTAVRAFLHVRDVAEGLLALAERAEPGEVFHFSPSEFHSIRRIVEIVCEEMGVAFDDVAEVAPERPGKDHAYLMDADKARRRLGWEPTVDLRAGIRETIEWARQHWHEIEALPWEYAHKP